MQPTGRLLMCARCRAQVFICRRCDRGNRYCTADCARAARRESLSAAGHRYQRSCRGRMAHAARARRYRARSKFVTHHSSPAPAANDVLQRDLIDATEAVAATMVVATPATSRCHCCGCPLPALVRTRTRSSPTSCVFGGEEVEPGAITVAPEGIRIEVKDR